MGLRKKTLAQLTRKLDIVFSKYIRSLQTECSFCKNHVAHCFHFIGRRKMHVRWDEDNVTGSCAKCNLLMNYSPEIFLLRYINTHGLGQFKEIVKKSLKPRDTKKGWQQRKRYYLEGMILKYEGKL